MKAFVARFALASIAPLVVFACSTEDDFVGGPTTGPGAPSASPAASDGGAADANAPRDATAPNDASSPPFDAASSTPVDAAPADPCAGHSLCQDFESTALGQAPGAPWVVKASKGSVTVDRTRAHSGKNSLKVSIEATTSSDTYRQAMLAVEGAPLIPLKDDTVFGRFYLWTDRVPDSSVHYTFASASGNLDGLYAVYNYGGMGNLMANYYRATTPDPNDCWQTKDQTFPTSDWKCVEFEYDGKDDEMHFWLDGTEIPELHVVGLNKTDQTCTVKGVDGRWLSPTFDSVRVGWESYQNDVAGAHDAWVDDVIFDSARIGCGP